MTAIKTDRERQIDGAKLLEAAARKIQQAAELLAELGHGPSLGHMHDEVSAIAAQLRRYAANGW